jgi:hypothetical protein
MNLGSSNVNSAVDPEGREMSVDGATEVKCERSSASVTILFKHSTWSLFHVQPAQRRLKPRHPNSTTKRRTKRCESNNNNPHAIAHS